MKLRLDLRQMRFLLGHPLRGDALLCLLVSCVAFCGFRLGEAQSAQAREQQWLAKMDRRLEAVPDPSDDAWGIAATEVDGVVRELVNGVEGARTWVATLHQAAVDAGFGIRLRWGDSEHPLSGWPQIENVRVVIEVDSSSNRHEATTRMRRFLQHLGLERPPFELERVRWKGSGRGLTGVVLEGRLWIRASES